MYLCTLCLCLCRFGIQSEDDEDALEEVEHRGRHRGERPHRCGHDHGRLRALSSGVHGQLDARNGSSTTTTTTTTTTISSNI